MVYKNPNFNLLAGQRGGLEKTQQEVADEVGVTRLTYLNWENGKFIPEAKHLNKLSESLEIEIGILVTYFENRSK